MATTFLQHPWHLITKSVRRASNDCFVAVAYFGREGSKLLPLRAGCTLVVNLSEAAVSAGQTHPGEIAKLIRRGVRVFSVGNLHAKVFVTPNELIIGSANVSRNSAQHLIEAAVLSTDRGMIKEARAFVGSLRGEMISFNYAQKLQKLWKPPSFVPGGRTKRRRKKLAVAAPSHNAAWSFPLSESIWSDAAQNADERGEPKARKKMQTPNRAELDKFEWDNLRTFNRVKPGHLIAQVVQTRGGKYVVPLGRLRHIQKFREDGSLSGIVYVEIPKQRRRKHLKRVIKTVGRDAAVLDAEQVRRIPEGWVLHDLLRLWM